MHFTQLAVSRSWCVLVVFFAFVSFSAANAVQPPNFIVVGTGGVTGVYHPAGSAICRTLNKNRSEHGIRCSVESTQGSVTNVNALETGEFDLAISQADTGFHAYHGSDHFQTRGADKELRSLFTLHSDLFTVVVHADSGINHFDDLIGKRVSIGSLGSGDRQTMDVVMKAKGWNEHTFAHTLELTSTQQAKALCNNEIDAFVSLIGHPSGVLKDVASRCDVMFVNVEGAEIDQLVNSKPFYTRALVPAGMYRGIDYDVPTFSINASLMASENTSDDVIYALVKNIFDDLETFQAMHPALKQFDRAQMTDSSSGVPTHAGALRYFKEVGLR